MTIENNIPEDFKFFSDEQQPVPDQDTMYTDCPEGIPSDFWEDED